MKFFSVAAVTFAMIGLVAASGAAPAPVLVTDSEAVAAAAPAELGAPQMRGLTARACVASKCTCNKVQGLFCGNQGINPYCTNGSVFECNASTGATCTYGPRASCQQCGRLSC